MWLNQSNCWCNRKNWSQLNPMSTQSDVRNIFKIKNSLSTRGCLSEQFLIGKKLMTLLISSQNLSFHWFRITNQSISLQFQGIWGMSTNQKWTDLVQVEYIFFIEIVFVQNVNDVGNFLVMVCKNNRNVLSRKQNVTGR